MIPIVQVSLNPRLEAYSHVYTDTRTDTEVEARGEATVVTRTKVPAP